MSDEELKSVSQEHKDQMHSLNPEASGWLINFVDNAGLVNGAYTRSPLTDELYNLVEKFVYPLSDAESSLKKWLYNRGIPFQKEIFLVDYYDNKAAALTWKMLIKYSEQIFYGSDKVVFDNSLTWCLAQFSVDTLHFGTKMKLNHLKK